LHENNIPPLQENAACAVRYWKAVVVVDTTLHVNGPRNGYRRAIFVKGATDGQSYCHFADLSRRSDGMPTANFSSGRNSAAA
jgi:hypothetical protein